MAAFFRGLLLFLFGAIVGAGGILFFTPSFNVVVSRSPGAAKPIEVAAAPAPVAVPAVAATTKVAAPATAPAPTAVAVAPATVAPATVVPTAPVADEPTIDFKSISEHLILWPTTVTVKAATTVPLMADGKKVQDLALDAGTVLQLSKVLADGSLEVRAKGAKFEIKSALTDFSVELGKRVSELVAKGAKIDSPFAATPPSTAPVAASAPVASAPVTTAPVVSVAAATPWVRLTLAQRVDVLFGNKPDTVVPAATVAPVTTSPAAPAATPAPAAVAPVAPVVEAAPAADPKAAEKGKDLDRKLNQLFK
jgi:hypothetical protein